MKFETLSKENHQLIVRVEIDSDTLEMAKRKSAKQLSKSMNIPGFRPGKAPYGVVRRHVGEQSILQEALDDLVNETYPKAIEESDVTPYGPGELLEIESGDRPVFKFLIPLAPEVDLGDYKSIRLDYEAPQVEEEDILSALENLQESQAVLESTDLTVSEGDLVYIALEAVDVNAEEGTEPIVKESYLPVVINEGGESDSDEWPFPGFSHELIELANGETKSLSHSFDENYKDDLLQGKEVEFQVEVKEIKSRTLPEIDDDLARNVGEYENLAALKTEIREQLEREFLETYESEYEDQILEKIIATSEIRYPPPLLEDEIKNIIEQLEHRLSHQNLDLDAYLEGRDMDQAELEEEVRPVAEDRIKRSLVLMEIASEEKVEVSQEELQKEVSGVLDNVMASVQTEDANSVLDQDAMQSLVKSVMNETLLRKTMKRIKSIASGEAEDSEGVEEGLGGLIEDESDQEGVNERELDDTEDNEKK